MKWANRTRLQVKIVPFPRGRKNFSSCAVHSYNFWHSAWLLFSFVIFVRQNSYLFCLFPTARPTMKFQKARDATSTICREPFFGIDFMTGKLSQQKWEQTHQIYLKTLLHNFKNNSTDWTTAIERSPQCWQDWRSRAFSPGAGIKIVHRLW